MLNLRIGSGEGVAASAALRGSSTNAASLRSLAWRRPYAARSAAARPCGRKDENSVVALALSGGTAHGLVFESSSADVALPASPSSSSPITATPLTKALGRPHTESSKKKISEAKTGKEPWNKGRKHSPETIAKIKARTAAAMNRPEVLAKVQAYKAERAKAVITQPEETKAKIKQAMLQVSRQKKIDAGLDPDAPKPPRRSRAKTRENSSSASRNDWTDPEDREKIVASFKEGAVEHKEQRSADLSEPWEDPENREKMKYKSSNQVRSASIAESMRKRWEDPEYRAKTVARMKEAAAKRAAGEVTDWSPTTRMSKALKEKKGMEEQARLESTKEVVLELLHTKKDVQSMEARMATHVDEENLQALAAARQKCDDLLSRIPSDMRYDDQGNVHIHMDQTRTPKKRSPPSPEHRAAISAAIRAKWEDPEYRAKCTSKIQEAARTRSHAGATQRAPRKSRAMPKTDGSSKERAPLKSAATLRQEEAENVVRMERMLNTKQLVMRLLATQQLVEKIETAMAGMERAGAEAFTNDEHMATRTGTALTKAESMLDGARRMLQELQAQIPPDARYDKFGNVHFVAAPQRARPPATSKALV